MNPMNTGSGMAFYENKDAYQTGNAFMNTYQFNNQANQTVQQPLAYKQIVSADDIKEMVQKLNTAPFNENMNLVTFDELQQLELLELLNRILAKLDSKNNVVIKDEIQQNTANRICEFLKILNYPSNFTIEFQQSLVQGDKKTINPILYYLLKNYEELSKRAYLANFLMSLDIPEELMGDEEIKKLLQFNRDSQAEFQVIHQQLEQAKKESMNPAELKKDLAQLEQEKEQLVIKINAKAKQFNNNAEFQALLEVTNLLRREQEEEARISEKIRTQKQQLEWVDQQLLTSQQRLIDGKKTFALDNTPEQMLAALRNEVKKNRQLCEERLRIEINEKRNKCEEIEGILNLPKISSEELNQMENKVIYMKKTVESLEEKLRNETNPADDRLAIFKQQASLVSKKKERIMEELKKAEEDQRKVEAEVAKKDQALEKLRGPGYKTKDDFKKYANNLREKTNLYKKMKDELKDIAAEISVLARTEAILKARKDGIDQELRKIEADKGILGATSLQGKLEEISEKKGEIDEKKGKTLEEISKIVQTIEEQLKLKRATLQPQIKDLKELRKNYNDIDQVYKEKKKEYEQAFASIESENSALETEYKKLKEEVYKDDTKISLMKYETTILDLKIQRLNEENEYQKESKTLEGQFKSYRDLFMNKISKDENEIKELRKQRDLVKENHEPSLRQMSMFGNLKKLLALKIDVAKKEAQKNMAMRKGDSKGKDEYNGNVNRLVIRD